MAKKTATTTITKDDKILVIVESPNKVKTISGILKKAGYSKASVMASVGHIMQLADDRKSFKNSGVYPEDNFNLNLKVSADKHDVVEKLKAQASVSDYVFLASDPDREGEVISWSLIKFLKLPISKCRRMVTHEITPKAIVHAIENPIEFDTNTVNAGLARLGTDKLIGYGLSPVAKTYIGAKSVGRCQSIGLKLVVDREKEIQAFVPEKYFDLYLKFTKGTANFKAKYFGTDDGPVDHFRDEKIMKAVVKACEGGDYTVNSINKREKQESPKPPFCTATFQQEAASRLGLAVKDAMSCAQKLFEGLNVGGQHIGLITYMRTDATDLAPEFIPDLQSYIEATYGKGTFNTPRVGKKDESAQDGHEALRVVDPTMTPEELSKYLSNDLLVKVYRLIWQRTIASAMPNAVISETTYGIENGVHKFNLVSNELVKPGYRAVYSYLDEGDTENSVIKETFSKGEKLANTELETTAKETKPKPRFTDATLVKELQKRGIGRPSTFATIVDTVMSVSRGYTTVEQKYIVPTERGMQLASFVDRAFPNIINLDFTKQMEEQLDSIAAGKLDYITYMTSFYKVLSESLTNNKEGCNENPNVTCPKCGGSMVVRRNKWGKTFYGCSNYPTCNGIVNMS